MPKTKASEQCGHNEASEENGSVAASRHVIDSKADDMGDDRNRKGQRQCRGHSAQGHVAGDASCESRAPFPRRLKYGKSLGIVRVLPTPRSAA